MNELKQYLKPLYKHNTERICSEIISYAKDFPRNENPYPNFLWYKFLNLYAIYPDAIENGNAAPLTRLISHLAHIKGLGCNALHILPFLASPLVDAGFDVSDYMRVRDDLGTMDDMKHLVQEAQKLGLRLFMDLVANHVSEEHEWFQKAQAGDEKYRRYFIVQKTKPRFVEKFHKDSAVWARYIVNGEVRDVNIAFPEMAGEIPHWREGKDKAWYYHTYYPQQLDLNWHNADVFLEFAKIIIFWTSLGFNFRLDAIPFVGKGAYKQTDEDHEFTHQLTAAFRYVAESINPECVFIVETYERIPVIARYLGSTHLKQSHLAYNFHLCTYLWVALVEQDATCIWQKLDEVDEIPVHADWINFLRNHDELSLAYLEDPLLSDVQNALMKYGEPFREKYGISGRTYSLLGRDEKRFLNAYFLVASLPGGVLIPYGDEVGKTNIPLQKLPPQLRKDSRNINRGKLTAEELNSAKGKRIMDRLARFMLKRQVLREYLNVWPQRLPSSSAVFAATYRFGVSELLVFVNITDKPQCLKIDIPLNKDYAKVLSLHECEYREGEITLSPYAGIWLQK
jgi:maltose alpha-D-glucosyltransferase/alpha-amylase